MASKTHETPWQEYVVAPRENAKAILLYASSGNWESAFYYELSMAQATAAEKVIRDHAERNPNLKESLGIPR